MTYQIKRERSADQHVSKTFDLTHILDLWGQVERSDIEILQIRDRECVCVYWAAHKRSAVCINGYMKNTIIDHLVNI